ncbi:MAG TPA: NBR1-Ig-like domain-containing protein [Anaerolineales bacterium]|nr:NBR1-Ig-like domain-containing protein [Anaerolineales bacterium]
MMYFATRSLIPLLLIGMLLASCGGQPAAGEPTPDVNATVAAGAETMAVSIFQTQTALAPSATNTPLPTNTLLPTSTALTLTSSTTLATQPFVLVASPIATGTFYTLTPSSASLAVGCNNLRLISSYTVPEGPFAPGQEFTQYWQVENNGTCDWVYLHHLAFVSGNRMGGSPGRLSKVIPPYKWTTLSVDLDAPNSNGTHTASWRFSDQGGTPFGATLPVSIKVENPSYP